MKHKMKLLVYIVWLHVMANTVVLGISPSIVEVVDQGNYQDVTFTCDPSKQYVLYGAEDQFSIWFHLKTITPGENHTTLSLGGEVPSTTISLPKPFLSWSTSEAPGLVVVMEADPEPSIRPEDHAQILNFSCDGDNAKVTFRSQPWHEYVIWASDTLKEGDWMPSDLLVDGVRNNVQLKVYGDPDGNSTTIELPIPFLPWHSGGKGFLKVTNVPGSFSSVPQSSPFVAAAANVAPTEWLLVCTRDGEDDLYVSFGDIGLLGVSGQIAVILNAAGPKAGESAKYFNLKATGRTTLKGKLVPNNEYRLPMALEPPGDDPDKKKPARQFVALSRYHGGSSPPEVRYLPDPDRHNHPGTDFQFELRIQSGAVIGTAVYKPESLLKDNIGLKPLGVGFDIQLPDNEGHATAQQVWAFAAMDQPMYAAFQESIQPEE